MRKSEKGKAMEPDNQLTKKKFFKRYALCPMLYHSEFRLPTSEFQILSSDLCHLFLSDERIHIQSRMFFLLQEG
jgi:hypothetical protein